MYTMCTAQKYHYNSVTFQLLLMCYFVLLIAHMCYCLYVHCTYNIISTLSLLLRSYIFNESLVSSMSNQMCEEGLMYNVEIKSKLTDKGVGWVCSLLYQI